MTESELAEALIDAAIAAGGNSLTIQLVQTALLTGETFRAILGALEVLEDQNTDVEPQLWREVNRYAEGLAGRRVFANLSTDT
jgi:hypothetical protein